MERDMLNRLATKTDLQHTREILSKDIQHQTMLITVRLGSVMVVGIGVLAALIKLA
jgi:hypothetical protein